MDEAFEKRPVILMVDRDVGHPEMVQREPDGDGSLRRPRQAQDVASLLHAGGGEGGGSPAHALQHVGIGPRLRRAAGPVDHGEDALRDRARMAFEEVAQHAVFGRGNACFHLVPILA